MAISGGSTQATQDRKARLGSAQRSRVDVPRPCAYCDRLVTPTQEHVWPGCFLERVGPNIAKVSVRGRTVHDADYVVRDVCADCNSVQLSPLDTYFCSVYDQYLVEPRDFGATVEFRYDYDLLARALLKIAYNSSRIGKSDSRPLAEVRRFMIGTAPRPEGLATFIELVAPGMVPEEGGATARTRKILPQGYHSAVREIAVPSGELVLARLLAVNSFWFHVFVPKRPLPLSVFEQIVDGSHRQEMTGAVRLDPSLRSVTVRTSPRDGLVTFRPQVLEFKDQYAAYFRKRRKK